MAYPLSPVNHGNTNQSGASAGSCGWRRTCSALSFSVSCRRELINCDWLAWWAIESCQGWWRRRWIRSLSPERWAWWENIPRRLRIEPEDLHVGQSQKTWKSLCWFGLNFLRSSGNICLGLASVCKKNKNRKNAFIMVWGLLRNEACTLVRLGD